MEVTQPLRLAATLVAIILFVLAAWPAVPHGEKLIAFGLAFLALAHL
jgi:hypothetical protein